MTHPPLRIVFFGTPEFAATSLRALLDASCPVVAVVTQPDRPRGRGRAPASSAVKQLAVNEELEVLQPEHPGDDAFVKRLGEARADLFVVVAYGRILPQHILDLPARDILNAHASLLPRWRGAAPVQHAILEGDHETGVSIQRVVRRLDAGPVFAQRRTKIGATETAGELTARLAEIGAALLVETVGRLAGEHPEPTPQDDEGVTFAPSLVKADGRVDFTQSAERIERLVRAMSPWPGAQTVLRDGTRTAPVRLLRCRLAREDENRRACPPGTAWSADGGLRVRTGRGDLLILELQPSGKRAMAADAFLRGWQGGGPWEFRPVDGQTGGDSATGRQPRTKKKW